MTSRQRDYEAWGYVVGMPGCLKVSSSDSSRRQYTYGKSCGSRVLDTLSTKIEEQRSKARVGVCACV